jgi:hypothetical protein
MDDAGGESTVTTTEDGADMRLAFRSHLPSHAMANHDVGGGITRSTCTICPHVEIHVADTSTTGHHPTDDMATADNHTRPTTAIHHLSARALRQLAGV